MILEFLFSYIQTRHVIYEPQKARFVFVKKKGTFWFGMGWSIFFLFASFLYLRVTPLYELLQAAYFVGTHGHHLTDRNVLFVNGLIFLALLLETVFAFRQVYHLLIEVTIVGERGVIRRNSRFFNSTALLKEINYSFTGHALKICKGKTLWLSLSRKTEYLPELLGVLGQINYESDTGGSNAM